jgi:hypothetical protein
MDRGEIADPAAGYRRRILRGYFLRFHMGLILCAVAAAGVLSSRLLLMAGVHSVLLRYPLAVGGAYLLFFALIRLWIAYVQPGRSMELELGDVDWPEGGGGSGPGVVRFGGGDSGGGGASSSWAASSGSGSGSGVDIDVDDGFWILIALAVLIAVVFGSGAYMVYVAPQILPDVAVHAAVASGLIHAGRKMEKRCWAESLFRCSVIPFLLVVAAAAALGYAVHSSCPKAVKLADAFHCES